MKVRLKNKHNIIGFADSFNMSSTSEIIFLIIKPSHDCDSVYIKDMQVMIYGLWINLNLAFRNKDIIIDNYNKRFFKPMNWEDRKQGYTLY